MPSARPEAASSPSFSFGGTGFLLLRPYGRWYPAVPVWDGPFDWDPLFYDQFYATWEPPLRRRTC